jgi:cytochrome P450
MSDDRRAKDFFENPHPHLAELRGRGGFQPDAMTGSVIATAHVDVCAILRHRDLSKDPRKLPEDDPVRRRFASQERDAPSMLFLDPPDHTRLRALVTAAFTPRRIDRLAPRIEAIANALLDGVSGRPTFDLLEILARPLPILVIGELLGIEAATVPEFPAWCRAMSLELNPMAAREALERAAQAKAAFNAFIRERVAERRALPRDDLLTALIEATHEGDQLSETELVSLCRLLLLAGTVTTTDAIGNGILALLDHPEELDRLRSDESLIGDAVEEMLRYDSSVTGVGRNVVDRAVSFGSQTVPPGTRIHASLAGANRDPAVFADPDRFVIAREKSPHVAFGTGIHVCLGAALARLEMAIAVRTLLRRFPRIALAVPRAELEWRRVAYFRGLERLPLAVESSP